MGSSASKPARSAAQAASRRQYPKQPSTSPSPVTRPQPQRAQQPQPTQPPRPAPSSQEPRFQNQPQTFAQGPVYHSKEKASTERSSAIDLDGRDPHFAASLRSLGPVTPSPTLSNSSTFNQAHPSFSSPQSSNSPTVFQPSTNPALLVLTSRQKIASEAEKEAAEFGKSGFRGRRFLDALTIRQAVVMRDKQGLGKGEVEKVLRIQGGVLGKLGSGGRKGVVGVP
ncbi:hypothetical protein BJX70DRAFT_271505 [Aspergillus crustosus]